MIFLFFFYYYYFPPFNFGNKALEEAEVREVFTLGSAAVWAQQPPLGTGQQGCRAQGWRCAGVGLAGGVISPGEHGRLQSGCASLTRKRPTCCSQRVLEQQL